MQQILHWPVLAREFIVLPTRRRQNYRDKPQLHVLERKTRRGALSGGKQTPDLDIMGPLKTYRHGSYVVLDTLDGVMILGDPEGK